MQRILSTGGYKAMRKILLSLISVLALAALVACGGSSSNSVTIPSGPSTGNKAGFSTSSLKGTYVYTAGGATASNNFATVGVFTADGAGNITSGTLDYYDDGGNQIQNQSVTGTYSVNQDGRGQLQLNGTSVQTVYRFVMQSPISAKLFQFSGNADATGRIELQSTVTNNVLGGTSTYIARFDGEDSGNTNPYAAIGGLTISGTSLTGTIDENDAGTFNPQLAATGTDTAPDANGRGTLTYTTSAGTHNFVYYWASPSHIELVSTDKSFFLYGYADLQTSVAPTLATFAGDQVFSISGFDSGGYPVLEAGRLTLDGAGNLTNGIEDYNDAGNYFGAVTYGGTYTVAGNGRWTAGLTYTSTTASTMNVVGWQVSPQQSVVLTTSIVTSAGTTATLETGTLRAQITGITTANISGNYAEDLSGFSATDNGDVESIANLDADGQGNLTGTLDSQTPGYFNTDIADTGIYSILANGRSPATLGSVPVIMYTVDADTIYLISSDSTRLYQGKMALQQP
jgi:hypothetical protein